MIYTKDTKEHPTPASPSFGRSRTAIMRRFLYILAVLTVGLAVNSVTAQTASDVGGGRNVSYTTPARASLPFASGETLTYEAKYNRILQGIPAADLTLSVEADPNSNTYAVKGEAVSKGTLLKLFRFSFEQQFQSWIDRDRFRALKTTKHDVQRERVRDSEAIFDYGNKRVTFLESDPKEPMKPPRRIASDLDEDTHDILSGIYALRSMPLEVGKTFNLTVSDSGLVFEIPVRVVAKEKQKTIFGRVNCFRVEPEVFGPGRMIEQKGSIVIWITDDARRIPVRSQVESSVGRVEIKLKTAKNLK
jgi:hypothetical protein